MLKSAYKSGICLYNTVHLNSDIIGKLKLPVGHLNVLTLESEQLKATDSRSVAQVQPPLLKLSLLKERTGHFRCER